MRFWITKNSELSIREQIVNQVMLGILSEDLPTGRRLPSVRALARLHKIHSNTVSSAYHELVERGWLEFRRGSGLYISAHPPDKGSGLTSSELDRLLKRLIEAGGLLGYPPVEILNRLQSLVSTQPCQRIAIAEPDPAMYEILNCEIATHSSHPIDRVDQSAPPSQASLLVALPSRMTKVEAWLPPSIRRLTLRLRSVTGAIEKEARPASNVLIAIVSKSNEVRRWGHAMLIAAGVEAECLQNVDSSEKGWIERCSGSTLIVTDIVSARELPPHLPKRVFHVIADSSIAELQVLLGNPDK